MTHTWAEKHTARRLEATMEKLGKSPAVNRFLGGYTELNSRRMYTC